MFEGSDFPQSLDEAQLDSWFEDGRASKIGYHYLLIVWDAFESKYLPTYAENREDLEGYEPYGQSTGRESLVAAYDLYSEARISLPNN